MLSFIDNFKNTQSFEKIKNYYNTSKTPMCITGISGSTKAYIGALLCSQFNEKGLFIVSNNGEAQKLYEDLLFFAKDSDTKNKKSGVYILPERELILNSVEGMSRENGNIRIDVLCKIADNNFKYIIATPDVLYSYILPNEYISSKSVKIELDQTYDIQELTKILCEMGYTHSELVEGSGQFAVRGGIFDVFPSGNLYPVRVEFFGDTPDSIGYFDPITQRRIENISGFEIKIAVENVLDEEKRKNLIDKLSQFLEIYEKKRPRAENEIKRINKITENLKNDIEKLENGNNLIHIDKYVNLLYKNPQTLLDYFKGLIFITDSTAVKQTLDNSYKFLNEDIKSFLNRGEIFGELGYFFMPKAEIIKMLEEKHLVYLESFTQANLLTEIKSIQTIQNKSLNGFAGNLQVLLEEIREYKRLEYNITILVDNPRKAANLHNILKENKIKTTLDIQKAGKDTPFICIGSLNSGIELGECGLCILTERAAVIHKKRRHKKFDLPTEKIKTFSDLNPGDYVVHENHGIGIYKGIEQITVENITKDYFKIQYDGSDALFVPCDQLDVISKYIGAGAQARIKLNKLSGTAWAKTKSHTKKAVRDLAKGLIKLYAERENKPGFSFSKDTVWQTEFEEKFNFEETDDQLRCISEIKNDMEKAHPMDRLLCGDVGFGKTEVALRAAFKAIMDSKQVAILVPTTILAMQHFNTIKERFFGYPVNIEMLSRYRSAKQQKDIIKNLQNGTIDIIVGTHKILQNNISFHDLGLVIIDEEQRFGVSHKEKLKELAKNVDTLTLSATPIPRTLNMALSGIRDMSIIEQAPLDRLPVQTYVMEYDLSMIIDCIQKELSRSGQVFYLYNKVETIDETAAKLQRSLPNAAIAVAHGKMSQQELANIWEAMVKGEIDVLVCTTIIETGVDIPNANTLIIEDAENFGLSQLHQIRGRVGRSSRKAYAYLTFRKGRVLSQIASKRLTAIREYTEFGSGFKIAMRDLELRGAGNVLGAEQHGFMENVGYDLYLKLLEQAVLEEKGQKTEKLSCLINLNISEHIPEKYISNANIRIDIYKKIGAVENKDDFYDLENELIDRFGDIPESVYNLMYISYLRSCAQRIGISEISQNNSALLFYLYEADLEEITKLCSEFNGKLLYSFKGKSYLTYRLSSSEDLINTAINIIEKWESIKS